MSLHHPQRGPSKALPWIGALAGAIAMSAGALVAIDGASRVAAWLRSAAAPPAEEPAPGPKQSLPPAAVPEDDSPSDPVAELAGSRRALPYNVVLLTIDTLRFDLGFTGYPRPVTPNLDALAARSTVFERAYALASYTPKSVGPMLLGRYATETLRDREHYTRFYPGNVFLAERVRAAGGRTAAGMCHLYFAMNFGLRQGFDVWDTSAMPPGMTDNDARVTGDKLSDVAITLLSRVADGAETPDGGGAATPFFAWFHYIDPHAPYVAHEGAPRFADTPVDGTSRARDLYDEEVWFADAQVGRVLDFVGSQPWAEDTAIIVTADHGEAFGEKGHWKHGREVWEPLVRVPLVVYVPGASPTRVSLKRSLIDLAPTVLDLLGIATKDGELPGTTLAADAFAGDGEELEERDVFIDMPEGPFNEARRAIITGPSPGMKLIQFTGGRYELYDLEADPRETTNLVGDEARFRAARAAFKRQVGSLKEIAPTP